MPQLFLVLFFIFLNHGLVAQTGLDSMYQRWLDDAESDSIRTRAYTDYIWQGYIYSDPDSAFLLGNELIQFGDRQDYPPALAQAYNIHGVVKMVQTDYLGSIDNFKKSLGIREQIGDQQGVAGSLMNIGTIYTDQGNDALGLDYYKRSLKIYEQLSYKKGIASILNNIGTIYAKQENLTLAQEYYERSLKINEELNSKRGISRILGNIGNNYKSLKNYDKAQEYHERSLKINKTLNDKKGMSNRLNDMGHIFFAKEDYNRALSHYQNSLELNEALGDQSAIALNLSNIGNTYNEQGQYTLAIKACKKSLDISKAVNSLENQRVACNCLYEVYKAHNSGNKALVYLEMKTTIEDSLNFQESAKKLQQMEFAKLVLADSLGREEEKLKLQVAHEKEINKKDRLRDLLLGSGFFVLLLAGGFFSRWRFVKKSRDQISHEKERSESLLLNILPAEIAEELKLKGSAEPRDCDQVSILFTDFKEFTQMSENMSAKELVGEINHCFKAFDLISEKYGIEKIKTIGDAYMAAGGLPVPHKNSTKHMVKAALEMKDFIIKRKAERVAEGKMGFEMRAGIHTGHVVAGIVGVKKFQYDIWGDTVNIASRMESNGEIRKVNISQVTYELIKDDAQFRFTSRGKVAVKGKGEIEMWYVESAE